MLYEVEAARVHPTSGRIKDFTRIVQPIEARNEYDAREAFLRVLGWQPWQVEPFQIVVQEVTPTRFAYLQACYSDAAFERTFTA